MKISQAIVGVLMLGLSILLMGPVTGAIFGVALFGIGLALRRLNLRVFNTVALGLLFGYLMGMALMAVVNAATEVPPAVTTGVYLFAAYLGVIMTMRAADGLHLSIPFVTFNRTANKTREILIDESVLADERLLDLMATGILDERVLLPRFLIKEQYLDVVQKMQELPQLKLRITDADFPDVTDTTQKMIRLARQVDGDILTANMSRVNVEGVRVVSMGALAKALKPLKETGEFLDIQIQRYGKEPMQGVGYLEDGTMVVVNGGGDYLGEEIKTRVLSVKHTQAGRMIFCNVIEEEHAAPIGNRY